MIWDKEHECMPRQELEKLQLARLQETVQRVYDKVPFYREAFDKKGIRPSDIQSLEDLKLLPFTVKQDLRDNYPFDLFAAPQEEIVRVHASSGTTGKPTVVGYTQNDINNWAELMARALTMAGATKKDVVQVWIRTHGFHWNRCNMGAKCNCLCTARLCQETTIHVIFQCRCGDLGQIIMGLIFI